MATRHIKRLQEQLEAKQEPAVEPESDEDEESGVDEPAAAPKFNPFDLLSDDEETAPAYDDEEEQQSDEAGEQPQQQPVQRPPPAPANSASSSASKKKKAKQKKKQAGKQAAAAAAGAADGAAEQQHEEDIDQLLQQLNMAPAAVAAAAAAAAAAQQPATAVGGGSSSSSAARQLPPLLGVDPRRIRGDAELRRMFGAGVVHAVDREQQGGARRGPGGGAAASARAAVRRRQLKKCLLVTPADHWPNVDSGISMKQSGTAADGSPLFCYCWSPNYAAAQRVFEQAQASYDPNAVAAVLHQFPYHVDSLLAMNELYRSMGEAQAAEDLLHRALFALEAAWPHGFDPAAAAVRLDIERPENKGLFVALFRHAQALSRRGCHGSALEVTKLLLGLDPEDPLGALLLLDYLALRAGSHDYLERFVAEFDSSHSLALLPNYAFALPLARFRLEQQRQQQQSADASGEQQPGSSSSKVTPVSSYTLLAQALLLHPRVLVELMAKLGGQGVGKGAAWQSLLRRKLYAKASDHGSESLAHLISLFVERSHSLWKAQDVQAWLKTAAEAAADVADGKPRDSSSSSSGLPASSRVRPDDVDVSGSAQDWACVAAESFPAGGRNEYGHLRVADFSDAVNALPQEEMQAAMAPGQGMNDAGAVEALNDMLLQEQLAAAQRMQQQQQQGGPAISEEELRGTNPLLMLLQSMLPWVNAGQQPDYAADDGSASQQQQQQGPGGGGQPPQ